MPKPRWTTSEPVKDMFAAFFSEGWVAQCDWVGRARKLEHPGFVTDRDLFAPGEYEQTPSYKFYRRHGVGYGAGLFLQIPSSDRFAFVFEQRHEDGPIKSATIERLNQLRPDLARAALIACRLGLERAQAATQTLAILGLPAVVLSATHRMLAANDLMQALMPDIVDEHAGSRFHLTNRLADARLAAALANTLVAAHPSDVKPVFSIPLVAQAHHPAMVAHVVPVRRQARDLFVGATNLVIMTPVCNQQLPSTDVIQGLFDLTPAESRVARLIGLRRYGVQDRCRVAKDRRHGARAAEVHLRQDRRQPPSGTRLACLARPRCGGNHLSRWPHIHLVLNSSIPPDAVYDSSRNF